MSKALLQVIEGKTTDRMPIWLMRQAGRYLPEYRTLRTKAGNFLDLCLTPKWASEITLQPVRRFDLDAAILFADILLVPMALGQKLEFREGEGPVLEKLGDETSLSDLKYEERKITAVFETIGQVKNKLPPRISLIGFCGGLWTVACYMIDGHSRNGFERAKQTAEKNPDFMERLFTILLEASEQYLGRQIEAGAEILQIFESWAGLLQGEAFERWVIRPTAELVSRLRKKYPHVPVIGFPREAGANYQAYAQKTGIDVLGIDQGISLDYAFEQLQKNCILQGNLDPALLVKGGEDMRQAARNIIRKLGPRHIFNLGHGVVPQTPPEHVAELIAIVRRI